MKKDSLFRPRIRISCEVTIVLVLCAEGPLIGNGAFKMSLSTVEVLNPDTADAVRDVVFGTLPENGLQTMTRHGVEFVLCASALTAQM